jgi:hypothetical protein
VYGFINEKDATEDCLHTKKDTAKVPSPGMPYQSQANGKAATSL